MTNKQLLTIALFCLASGLAQTQAEPAHPAVIPDQLIPQKVRKPAPDFTLADSKGQSLTLTSYKGRVVLLDFWATWCGGCKQELPWFIEFDKQYASRGLSVIGVSMDDEGMTIVKPFLASRQIRYPVVIGTDVLAREFGLTFMPMTLLIDRDGRIALSHSGVVDRSSWEKHIQQLLAEPHRPPALERLGRRP